MVGIDATGLLQAEMSSHKLRAKRYGLRLTDRLVKKIKVLEEKLVND